MAGTNFGGHEGGEGSVVEKGDRSPGSRQDIAQEDAGEQD